MDRDPAVRAECAICDIRRDRLCQPGCVTSTAQGPTTFIFTRDVEAQCGDELVSVEPPDEIRSRRLMERGSWKSGCVRISAAKICGICSPILAHGVARVN